MPAGKPPVPGDRLRVCDLCGGVDYDPRHVIGGGQADLFPKPSPGIVRTVMTAVADLDEAEADRLIGELMDTSSRDHHMDCCRETGCDVCTAQTAGLESVRGQKLRKQLINLGADDIAPGDDSIVKGE